MSPDQLTTAQLEHEVERLKAWLENPTLEHSHQYYASRLKLMEAYLKERAEAGTY